MALVSYHHASVIADMKIVRPTCATNRARRSSLSVCLCGSLPSSPPRRNANVIAVKAPVGQRLSGGRLVGQALPLKSENRCHAAGATTAKTQTSTKGTIACARDRRVHKPSPGGGGGLTGPFTVAIESDRIGRRLPGTQVQPMLDARWRTHGFDVPGGGSTI